MSKLDKNKNSCYNCKHYKEDSKCCLLDNRIAPDLLSCPAFFRKYDCTHCKNCSVSTNGTTISYKCSIYGTVVNPGQPAAICKKFDYCYYHCAQSGDSKTIKLIKEMDSVFTDFKMTYDEQYLIAMREIIDSISKLIKNDGDENET